MKHPAKQKHTAKIKFAVCSRTGTRRRLSSPCAPTTTHGEAGSTCAGRPSTLTAVGCGSTPSNFAVSHRFAHGEPYSLPCASGQHTATSWTRWRFNNGSWTACPLPCAGVRHTVKVSVCRVLETGTRQTLGFAVCWPYCTRQNKSKQHEPLN